MRKRWNKKQSNKFTGRPAVRRPVKPVVKPAAQPAVKTQPPKLRKPAAPRRPPSLAVASFVCGMLSFPLLIVAGLPAVVLGHLARGRLRRGLAAKKGHILATAGLILGYVSFATTVGAVWLFYSTEMPDPRAQRTAAKLSQQLGPAGEIALAIQTMALDGQRSGKRDHGWPADAGITSTAELRERLVAYGYLSAERAGELHFENFLIGNVSKKDRASVTLIRPNPARWPEVQIIVRKGGDGEQGVLPRQTVESVDPPRDPPYLMPLP